MLALRVTINDRKPIVAGTEDLLVLSAIVSLTGKLGAKTADRGRGKPDMHLHIGGLTARTKRKDQHLKWTPHVKLKVGDRIMVELIKTAKADPVVGRTLAEKRDERTYFEHIKKQYLEMKKKYEPDS